MTDTVDLMLSDMRKTTEKLSQRMCTYWSREQLQTEIDLHRCTELLLH